MPPSGPGSRCDNPQPVASEGQAESLGGYWESDAWFSFTPEVGGCYRIQTDVDYAMGHSHALYDGLECDPLGPEIGSCPSPCNYFDGTFRYLKEAQGYLVTVGMWGASNPTVLITLRSTAPGLGCEDPQDLTGATFPVEPGITFECYPSAASDCLLAYTAWFRYQPSVTGPHTITMLDQSTNVRTGSYALALYAGEQCPPPATPTECVIGELPGTANGSFDLVQGETYLIAYSVDEYNVPPSALQVSVSF